MTFTQLASASGLREEMVRRIVRHAAAYHIFREPRKGFIEHTAASKMLAVNPQMRQWILMVTEEMWPAATKVRSRNAERWTLLMVGERRSTL